MKLEPRHLAPYLPYGLRIDKPNMLLKGIEIEKPKHYYALIEYLDEKAKCKCCDAKTNDVKTMKHQIWTTQPLLRPLSDLTKEIKHDGEKFIPLHEIRDTLRYPDLKLSENNAFGSCEFNIGNNGQTFGYCVYEKLFKWHFDVFGLIPKGLAIEK